MPNQPTSEDSVFTTHVGGNSSGPGPASASQAFGGATARSRPANLRDLESRLSVWSLFMYWKDTRGHRLSVQRSIVVTGRPKEQLEKRLGEIAEEFGELSEEVYDKRRDYKFDLMSVEKRAEEEPKKTHSSSLVAVSGRLVATKRSSHSGEVYRDLSKKYCPHSKSKLNFFVSTTSQPAKQ